MKVNYNGKEVEATEVGVLASYEHWSEAQLGDGNILAWKDVLVYVCRPEGVNNPDGSPFYYFKTSRITKVKSPK